MNLKAYAEHRKKLGLRGGSHVAVLKAIDSGRIYEPAVRKIDGRWQIDPELADAQWAGNTSRMDDTGGALPESPNTRQPHAEGGGPSLAQAKRARAVYEAELKRLELQKARGEVTPTDQVEREASRMGRLVRDLLLPIPSRNAAMLASMTDRQACHDLLMAELMNALKGLKNEIA